MSSILEYNFTQQIEGHLALTISVLKLQRTKHSFQMFESLLYNFSELVFIIFVLVIHKDDSKEIKLSIYVCYLYFCIVKLVKYY